MSGGRLFGARDERVVARRAGLENRFVFEGPRFGSFGDYVPVGMAAEDRLGIVVIRGEIGAEIKARALPCPSGHGGEEIGLHNAMLMMAKFGPRVGKKDEKAGKRRVSWEGFEE